MARKPKKLTEQEALVTAFSRHSISAGATFNPQQWSSGTEPADMVIAVGRSLLLFNMTKSRAYLSDLIRHNVDQATDRIQEWSTTGRQIRGKNATKNFVIDWADIDHIAVISVVDGPHAACCLISAGMVGDKVRLCVALTSEFLTAFALLGGSARDLIRFSRTHLSAASISSATAVAALRAYYELLRVRSGNSGLAEPKHLGRAIVRGKQISWFDEHCATLIAPRQHVDDHLGVFSDFSWSEVFAATCFVTISAREMESAPTGQIRTAAIGTTARLFVVVSSNMKALAEHTPRLIEASRDSKCPISYYVNLTNGGLLSYFAVDAEPESWAIDAELAAGQPI